MKSFFIGTAFAAMLFSSCKTSQLATYTDDVYANPAEEKKLEQLAAAEKAKQEALEQQKLEEQRAAQKAKDDANPYYKDPNYNKDDYYDYEYASRINRFHNPIGTGYYDPYYTNMYSYNQNPAYYGTSIYSSYNYGMPSSQFNNYSMGISTGWGYGYNNYGYNNYGYNNYYSPYGYYGYNNYYNPYGFYGYNNYCSPYSGYYGYSPYSGYGGYYGGYNWGYNNSYYNGYYNGWNSALYYNSYDPNSAYSQMQYGPRGSSGSNSQVRTDPGMAIPQDNGRHRYVQSVIDQQNNSPRFISSPERMGARSAGNDPNMNSQSGNYSGNSNNANNDRIVRRREPENVNPDNNNSGNRSGDRIYNNSNRGDRVEQNNNSQNRSNQNWNNNSNSNWNNSGFNSGSSPRGTGSGGGGGGRHR